MAKSNTIQIKLVSTADTGYFYVTKKNARAQTGKMEMLKYDPVAAELAWRRTMDFLAKHLK